MKNIWASLVLGAFLIGMVPQTVGATAPSQSFSDFELRGVVQIVAYDRFNNGQTGTGFLLDFTGECALTATHVIADEEGNILPHVFIVVDAGTPDEQQYSAVPVIAYGGADVAMVCTVDEDFTVDGFRHYFTFNQEAFDDLALGDDLVAIGYPASAGDTVTATFGNLSGFLSVFFEDINDILKMDMGVSPGISGGPVLNEDDNVVGMVVGYDDGVPGGLNLSYAVSTDLINIVFADAMGEYAAELEETGDFDIPDDCEYDDEAENFSMGEENIFYYDIQCSIPVSERRETTLRAQYVHWCEATPDDSYISSAARMLTDTESYDFLMSDWLTYLNGLCGDLPEDDTANYFTPDQDLGARLVKTNDSTTVYAVLEDGKRHAFGSAAVYASWYGMDFGAVETISSREMASYMLGFNITYHPGTLVKIPSIAKTYVISDDNALLWVENEETAQRMFGASWAQLVQDIPESLFANYTIGESIDFAWGVTN